MVFADFLGFDLADDALFSGCPGQENGYLPLLRLNKKYDSDAIGNKSGYEILSYYLDTAKVGAHVALDYNLVCDYATNITGGFDAAKDAMSKSLHPKKNQFIIFISDGAHTVGGDDYIAGNKL